MGWIPCQKGDAHFRKWDTDWRKVGDETWILVSQCYHCGDAPYWEVYPTPGEDEMLASEPLRVEPK